MSWLDKVKEFVSGLQGIKIEQLVGKLVVSIKMFNRTQVYHFNFPQDVDPSVLKNIQNTKEWENEFVPRLLKADEERRFLSQPVDIQARVIAETSAAATLSILSPKTRDRGEFSDIGEGASNVVIAPSAGPPFDSDNGETA